MQVCCRACGDILTYERDDTSILVQHIRNRHPEKSVVCLPAVYSDENANKEGAKSTSSKSSLRKNKKADQNESEPDTDDLQKCSTSNMNSCISKYKYTVQYYGHSKKLIKCPMCKKEMYPVLRQKTNRTLPSLIRALFYLTCWPVNFLPFLLCGKKEYHLYCSKCQKKIGSQDKNGDIVLKEKEGEKGDEEKEEEEEEEEEGGGGGESCGEESCREESCGEETGSDNKEKKKDNEGPPKEVIKESKEPEDEIKENKEDDKGKGQNKDKPSKKEDDDDDEEVNDEEVNDEEVNDEEVNVEEVNDEDSQVESRYVQTEVKEKERRSKETRREKYRKSRPYVKHTENFISSTSSVPPGRILGRKSGKVFK